MTTAPGSLLQLRSYLADKTGLSAVSLGIVGNERHTRGYHLGRDRIYSSAGVGDADYSIQNSRDRAGLTNAASAIDIGMFPKLRDMSAWLVERCRSNAVDCRDIREVFYSIDGQNTLWWDRQRGVNSAPILWNVSPHTNHSHISWYRDSETRPKLAPFQAYFDDEVADMLAIVTRQPFAQPITWTTRPGSRLIGYDPARPNVLAVDRTWSVASSARAAAAVSVSWSGTTNPPIPRGGPFLEVLDGVYAGLLIVGAAVDWIAPPTQEASEVVYDRGYNAALADLTQDITRRVRT